MASKQEASKDVDAQEHYEVSWDDSGNRRHQLAFEEPAAHEVARGFIEDHNLEGVEIHRVTVTREPIEVQLPKKVEEQAQ